jgi:hypothetical protein
MSDLGNVAGRHFHDARVRHSIAIETCRLQAVHGLIVTEMARKISVTHHVPTKTVNTEQRRQRSSRLNRNQHRRADGSAAKKAR